MTYRKSILKIAIIVLLNVALQQNSSAYTGWPGGKKTKDLGKEALNRQKAGDLELAIKLHERILKLEPCNAWSYEKLGDIQQQYRDYEQAIFYYAKAQEVIKCNKTEHIGLDDYTRISKKIKNATESKKEDKPEKKEKADSGPFRKGDKVVFEATSILFNHKYTVEGVIVLPGSSKSRVKITDNGGSIYINKEVYSVENVIMEKKR